MSAVRSLPAVGGPGPTTGPGGPAVVTPTAPSRNTSFDEVLRRETDPAAETALVDAPARTSSIAFSRHAAERVERRGIEMHGENLERLNKGVDRAAEKGARESVVFLDGTAFVVSVKNRTVITAVDPEHMRQHVFTNIDSAVIA